MKITILTLWTFLLFQSYVNAQSLFLPNGIQSIASSANGNVGIGTASPYGQLQVNPFRPIIMKNIGGNGIYGSEIGFNAILNTQDVPNKFIKLGGTSQMGGVSIVTDHWGNMFFQMYNADTENESIINYAPQVTFQNNGNVGIGTTSPVHSLELHKSLTDNSNLVLQSLTRIPTSTGGSAILRIGYYGSSDIELNGIYSGSGWRYGSWGDLNIVNNGYSTYGGINLITQSVVRMSIKPDGNIGIGITDPGNYKLNVNGTIRAREVIVNTDGADFVFHPSYNLPDPGELELYIRNNNHLTGFAPASKMQEDGMNVSEMQTKLLQKIEELTLYIIHQEKRMKILEQKFEDKFSSDRK